MRAWRINVEYLKHKYIIFVFILLIWVKSKKNLKYLFPTFPILLSFCFLVFFFFYIYYYSDKESE
jgi:hypothetical protein